MTGSGSRPAALALLVLGTLAVAPAAGATGDPSVPGHRVFTFEDSDIIESSGLVDRGSVVFTNNDSGDAAVVYGVDPATGRTVSRTTYAGSVEDVEAIAPGAHGSLWAGDVGDNGESRDDVQVYRIADPADGDHPGTRYTLTYPDGPHNAEALLVHPRTGRVFVVTKSVFGGTVYAAPRHLRPGGATNRLRAFAQVAGLVTDGTFLPDGRRVLLRTYGTASVYTFPGFDRVGTVRLPAQPQGEGISVSSTGRVLVSSEGLHSEVLRVRLPATLTGTRPATAPPVGPAPATRSPEPAASAPGRTASDWGWIALAGAGVAGLGYLTLRAARVRSR